MPAAGPIDTDDKAPAEPRFQPRGLAVTLRDPAIGEPPGRS